MSKCMIHHFFFCVNIGRLGIYGEEPSELLLIEVTRGR